MMNSFGVPQYCRMHSESFIDGAGTYQVLDGPVLRGMQKPSPDLGKTQVC